MIIWLSKFLVKKNLCLLGAQLISWTEFYNVWLLQTQLFHHRTFQCKPSVSRNQVLPRILDFYFHQLIVLHTEVLSGHLAERARHSGQTEEQPGYFSPQKMVAQKRFFGPSWNPVGKESLKGNRKCQPWCWQILLSRQHSTQPVGRDFFWSGPNAPWAGLAGIRKLRSSLHADNKCKCYLWQVQTYCSSYSEVAEQALLFFLQSRFIPT